jgi:hypothetical protein
LKNQPINKQTALLEKEIIQALSVAQRSRAATKLFSRLRRRRSLISAQGLGRSDNPGEGNEMRFKLRRSSLILQRFKRC